ncbi:MAG: tetratricopeptide repeat protein [Flavobacteriaceae bacterium]|nr:tetratricopeptide repeat protein [Flavobacteriaceae bacterium]
MATYKKRGNKIKGEHIEKKSALEQNSTTAEVFNTLDETASRSEDWVIKNQQNIFIILGVVVVVILGFLGYQKYIVTPGEKAAADELAFPKKYFNQAIISSVSADSLFVLGLEGGEGKFGFIDIADEYSGTKSGNLANYYAGISYLRMNKYHEAIEYLEKFSSDDLNIGPVAEGAIGDAFAELDQLEDALSYYEKAASLQDNAFTSPLFLFKAGNTALELKDPSKALSLFEKIKSSYPKSEEAKNIDIYINKAKYSK